MALLVLLGSFRLVRWRRFIARPDNIQAEDPQLNAIKQRSLMPRAPSTAPASSTSCEE